MVMSGRRILFLVLWMHLGNLYAGQLVGELDKSSGNTSDQFLYTLSIEGSFDGQPKIPEIDGVLIQSGGTEQSTQIVNGQVSRSFKFNFILEPQSPGSYEIPEISLAVDGRIEKTLPLKFVVKEIDPSEQQKEPFFVQRELNKSTVYEGEFFTLSNRIFIGGNIDGGPQVAPLETPPGFRVYNFDNTNRYSKSIAGNSYEVLEQKYILIPDSSGDFLLPSFVAQITIPKRSKRTQRDLFGFFAPAGTPKRMKSPASPIKVIPLPQEGRSKDFSGLVGEFDLSVSAEPKNVKAGESVTISVVVEGVGETDSMTDLDLKIDKQQFKVYKDKPIDGDSLNYDRGIIGKREFKFAVIPKSSGEYDLGDVSINFFDPITKTYKTSKKAVGAINVSASANPNPTAGSPRVENPKIEKQEVNKIGNDILGLHAPERLFENQRLAISEKLVLIIGFISGCLVMGLSYFFSLRRLTEDQRHTRQAYKKAFKHYQDDKKKLLSQNVASELAASDLQKMIKKYLANRLMIHTETMTVGEVEKLLRDRKISEADIEPFIKILNNIDQIKFSPNKQFDLKPIVEQSESIILSLEKQF